MGWTRWVKAGFAAEKGGIERRRLKWWLLRKRRGRGDEAVRMAEGKKGRTEGKEIGGEL